MQHKSTFDLMIGNACIQQIDVCADVNRAADGDWYVSAVYADALEIGGKCPEGDAYVEIKDDHFLHNHVLMHFLTKCHDDIERKWRERRYGRSFVSTISAGRTYQ